MSEKLSERCLTSSQTIPPVLPALVRQHPPVISSVAGGSLEMRHRLPDRLGRVGELKGGGKAGGAGWRERVAFRQTGSPPSETARMASRVSASAKEPSGLWPQPLGGRNHSPPNFPEIVLPFSAWKRRLRLEKMACNLTKPTPGNSAMRPKNRVWGVSRNDRNLPLENRLRCPELRRKSGPTPTFFTPGIPQWPSRDPIEEGGGVNLYGFVRNDGIDWVDLLGLWDMDGLLKCLCKCKEMPREHYLDILKKYKFKTFKSIVETNTKTGAKSTSKPNGLATKLRDTGEVIVLLRQDDLISNEVACNALVEELVHAGQLSNLNADNYSKYSKLAQKEIELRHEIVAKVAALEHSLHNGYGYALREYLDYGSGIIEHVPGTPPVDGYPGRLSTYKLKSGTSHDQIVEMISRFVRVTYTEDNISDPTDTRYDYENLSDVDTSKLKCP